MEWIIKLKDLSPFLFLVLLEVLCWQLEENHQTTAVMLKSEENHLKMRDVLDLIYSCSVSPNK